MSPPGTAAGPHGLFEIVYAYASSAADNGSSFAGLNANTRWYNVTTGIAMFFGRFAHAIPILAIAGSLAAKRKAKPSAGTMPSDGPLFVLFLLSVIVIVTLLQSKDDPKNWSDNAGLAVPNSRAVQRLPGGSTRTESRAGRIGPISLGAKQTGERSARKSACCVRRGGGWKRGTVEMV